MGRKTDSGVSFVSGYAVARHSHKQAAASAAADEAAWQQAYAQMEYEAELAREAVAEAARDEIRYQAALARRATWMCQDPVGRAWRDVTNPGGADERLAQHIETQNLTWREAWARQCDADGIGPVAARKVGGLWVIQPLMNVVLPLLGIAVVLFVLNTGAWLVNHSIFTPETRFYGGETLPKRGTRDFLTPGLAIGAYVAAGLAVLAYATANALDFRALRALRRADAEAEATNEARTSQRLGRYGFDPLAARIPSNAHWATLGDGTDPEQALALLTVEDPRQMQQPERMTMAHVERLRAIADWCGRVREVTPGGMPPGMVAELDRMRRGSAGGG